jgi:hypothetical protein
MDVIWLIAGFGVGAFGMWTILQVQSGNNFGIGGSSGTGTPTNPTQSVADGPPNPFAGAAPGTSPNNNPNSDSTSNFTGSDGTPINVTP